MTDKNQELRSKAIRKITDSVMKRENARRLAKALQLATAIDPGCEEIALKLRALCEAEDDRTPAEYSERKYEWEGRSPFLLEDGSPKPEVVEWAKQLYSFDRDVGMYSVVECIPYRDIPQLHTAFVGIGGWVAGTGEWPASIGRSAWYES